MAAKQIQPPKVYMFSEDQKNIERFAREHKDGKTSGDLFGLWTNENELVIHLVTGEAGSEKTGKSSASPKSKRAKEMKKALCERFSLPRIGKWQYVTTSTQSESVRDMAQRLQADKGLFRKEVENALLITLTRDQSKLHMSPFLVSKTSVSEKGEIDTLQGENVYGKLDEIKKITGEFLISQGDRPENESVGERAITVKAVALPSEHDASKKSLGRLPSKHIYDDFRVNMFQEDTDMMTELVLTYPTVETGGDLFGLWTSEGEAMIHVVLGPGRNCRRTDVSFHQDVPYLQRNGELLTDKYMLCHIGEWHSHHQLHLHKPSHGDSSTVIRNYPRGVQGFILIIANIIAPGEVSLSPYLYTQQSRFTYDKSGQIICLPAANPFKIMFDIRKAIKNGMETEEDVRRNKRSHHQQNWSIGENRNSRRTQPPTRANAQARHNADQSEPMDWSYM